MQLIVIISLLSVSFVNQIFCLDAMEQITTRHLNNAFRTGMYQTAKGVVIAGSLSLLIGQSEKSVALGVLGSSGVLFVASASDIATAPLARVADQRLFNNVDLNDFDQAHREHILQAMFSKWRMGMGISSLCVSALSLGYLLTGL